MTVKKAVQRCLAHNEPALGYLEWHYDAERRGNRGEQQRLCRLCFRWIWEEHYTDASCMGDTEAMAKARARSALKKGKK